MPWHPVFCQGFKNEGTFVPSPLKMRGHQSLCSIITTSKFVTSFHRSSTSNPTNSIINEQLIICDI